MGNLHVASGISIGRYVLAAATLLGLTLAPWRLEPTRCASAVSLHDVVPERDLVIRMPMSIAIEDVAPMPNAWLGNHPDSRPWPFGMVIGTPASPDRMALVPSSFVTALLESLLGPFVELLDLDAETT